MTMAEASVEQPPDDKQNFRTRFLGGLKENWLAHTTFIVLVMALAAVVIAITGINQTSEQNTRLRRLVECQNSYNEVNNERTRQLAIAADRTSRADEAYDSQMDAVLATLIVGNEADKKREIEALRATLKEKKTARDLTIQERKLHPVPPPPRALCGSAG